MLNPPSFSDRLKVTPQPQMFRYYDHFAKRAFGRLIARLFQSCCQWKQNISKRPYNDDELVRQIGSNMRFFLNSAVIWIIVFSIALAITLGPLSIKSLLLASIPIFILVIFFLVFLVILKRIEAYAARKRNIDLVSRAIWEFNKSSFIRCLIGKLATFIKE